ncbi:hypothetical protein BJ508DRAFT_371520 [Ascobolus immersus RN42]|uniref:C2H2-type domain-containing protein n=1 Tax=Ascobolus immersus RN42 TaxID=1160509 RepID=A0A3N4IPC9_ASCIM|nr:hypothetical protein BJ508DRAFT_371520 [Ascobolus immersus RN42]
MAVSMQRKRSAGSIQSQTLAYPSPSHSPAIGISRLPESKLQWCQESPVTTYDPQGNIPAWSNGYPQQRTLTPVIQNIQTADTGYGCLPSPPPQSYNNLEAEYGSMPIDPRTRHMLSTPTSEAMMPTTSAEHSISYTSSVATGSWTTTAYSDNKEHIANLISLSQGPQPDTTMSSPLSGDYGDDATISIHTGFNSLQISPEPPKWENRSPPPIDFSNTGVSEDHTVRTSGTSLYSSRGQPRRKRQLTTREEANYKCLQCGKYFSRVWNFNAHKNTHDPNRAKPHHCGIDGCEKRFVRRTDLVRHTSCVHQRVKKWACGLCGNKFARKDTLRRHEDDGCPKRVDIPSRHGKGMMNPKFLNFADKFLPPPASGSHMEMMPNPNDPRYQYQHQHQQHDQHSMQHPQHYQQHHEQQLGYPSRSQAPSHPGLPPLSVALQNTSPRPDIQHQQQMWR